MFNKNVLRKGVIVAIIAQVFILAFMAGKRETIVATGKTLYLRSAPIDPRDPFRGDFVRLRYGINSIHQSQYQGVRPFEELNAGQVLYTALKHGADDVYSFDYLTDQQPKNATFIRARVNTTWSFMRSRNGFINLKYGIEQYFVEQGKGKAMEDTLGTRDALQIPVEMRLAVGGDGTAVITDHRWSKLGIQLAFIQPAPERRDPNDAIVSPIISITMQNVSQQPLTLAHLADDCSFSLVHYNNSSYKENADRGCTINTQLPDTTILQPDESKTIQIDFSETRWHVDTEGEHVETGSLLGWHQFRIVYTAPSVDGTWQGTMQTPLFSGNGRVD